MKGIERKRMADYWDYIQTYWFLIEYNVEHIRHSEIKASIIITVYGIVFGVVYDLAGPFQLDNPDNLSMYFIYLLVGIFIILSIISILYCFKTLIPRINKKLQKSVFFFHDIKHHYKSPDIYSKELNKVMLNDNKLRDLLAEQVYINGEIGSVKYSNVAKAINFLMYSIYIGITLIICELVFL